MKASRFEERLVKRILVLKDKRNISDKELAAGTKIHASTVSKLLNLKQQWTLPYLEEFCFFFQKTAAELLAEPHVHWTQLREREPDLIARFRDMDYDEQRSLLAVLDWRLKKPIEKTSSRRGTRSHAERVALQFAEQYVNASPEAQRLVAQTLAKDALKQSPSPDEHMPDLEHQERADRERKTRSQPR